MLHKAEECGMLPPPLSVASGTGTQCTPRVIRDQTARLIRDVLGTECTLWSVTFAACEAHEIPRLENRHRTDSSHLYASPRRPDSLSIVADPVPIICQYHLITNALDSASQHRWSRLRLVLRLAAGWVASNRKLVCNSASHSRTFMSMALYHLIDINPRSRRMR